MKKIILLTTVILLFVGCQSKESKAVDTKIKQLGEISLTSENEIKEIENAYDNLSDIDKKDLKYFDKLKSAREELINLQNERKELVKKLCVEGKYTEALENATEEEKKNILLKNKIAPIIQDIGKNLKNPESLIVRDIYTNIEKCKVIITITAQNSFGGMTSSIYIYTILPSMEDNVTYTYSGSVHNMDEEDYDIYDSEKALRQKVYNNLVRERIREAMKDSNKVSTDTIGELNETYKLNKFKNVVLKGF